MGAMLRPERQDGIVRGVLRRGPLSVAELAASLDVSVMTIRRDLDELDQQGRLQRIDGGARPRSPRGPEPPIVQRHMAQVPEKRAIATAALGLLADGDVIALESCPTTLELARAIARQPGHDLLVATDSLRVAEELIPTPGVNVALAVVTDSQTPASALDELRTRGPRVVVASIDGTAANPRAGSAPAQ